VANQLQAYDLLEVVRPLPIFLHVDYFALFDKASIDGLIELFGLIGGGNQKAVAAAVDNFIKHDV